MNSTPSNGSGGPGRSAKVSTMTASSEAADIAAAMPSQPFEAFPAIVIEGVEPALDDGRWPVKRVVGDIVDVSANIFKEGHDVLQARVVYRRLPKPWLEARMLPVANDRWAGSSAWRTTRVMCMASSPSPTCSARGEPISKSGWRRRRT